MELLSFHIASMPQSMLTPEEKAECAGDIHLTPFAAGAEDKRIDSPSRGSPSTASFFDQAHSSGGILCRKPISPALLSEELEHRIRRRPMEPAVWSCWQPIFTTLPRCYWAMGKMRFRWWKRRL